MLTFVTFFFAGTVLRVLHTAQHHRLTVLRLPHIVQLRHRKYLKFLKFKLKYVQ